MKTITWIRHGKSSWDNPKIEDHSRPLLPKGSKRTEIIARFISEQIPEADLIICSTATRAKKTAHIIADAMEYQITAIQEEHILYEARSETYLDLIYPLENSFNHIIMVGHNPEITEIVNMFLDKPIDWLPTSGAVCIEFDTEKWEEIAIAHHKTKFCIFSSMLKPED